MNTVQYLKQLYGLNDLINSCLQELGNLRALCASIASPKLSGMPPSATKTKDAQFTVCIQKIIDLERTIDEEIDRYVDLNKEVRETINQLYNVKEKLVLRMRYIHFLSWEEISEKMGYSVMQVHRIHDRAIKKIKIPKNVT